MPTVQFQIHQPHHVLRYINSAIGIGLLAAAGAVYWFVYRALPEPIYFFGGLIMMWAPAVPGYISHGALSLGLVDSPVDSGVAKGT